VVEAGGSRQEECTSFRTVSVSPDGAVLVAGGIILVIRAGLCCLGTALALEEVGGAQI
jgi:hypothetical protein